MALEYQRAILAELLDEDALCIIARGLGAQNTLLLLLKLYCNSNNVVLILNATHQDQQLLLDGLLDHGTSPSLLPKRITADYSLQERYNNTDLF